MQCVSICVANNRPILRKWEEYILGGSMVKQSVLIQKKALNEVMNDMIEPFCCCCSTVNEDCVGEAPPLPGSLSITLSSDSCWATVPFSFLLSLLHSNRGTRGGSFACKVILRLLLHTHTKPHTHTHGVNT